MLEHIYSYVNKKGEAPVEEFLDSLPEKERAKALAYIDELKIQGHNMKRPMADYIDYGIYELRPKDNRIFYFFFLRKNAVMLHAIRKKTKKIPVSDLKVCLKRKSEVEKEKKVKEIDLGGK